jgi:hypothetical protein
LGVRRHQGRNSRGIHSGAAHTHAARARHTRTREALSADDQLVCSCEHEGAEEPLSLRRRDLRGVCASKCDGEPEGADRKRTVQRTLVNGKAVTGATASPASKLRRRERERGRTKNATGTITESSEEKMALDLGLPTRDSMTGTDLSSSRTLARSTSFSCRSIALSPRMLSSSSARLLRDLTRHRRKKKLVIRTQTHAPEAHAHAQSEIDTDPDTYLNAERRLRSLRSARRAR